MKSYNTFALRGLDVSDDEFQQDMAEQGINIPDHLLYKPAMNDFVLDAVNKQTKVGLVSRGINNPATGKPFTIEEASEVADNHTKAARENIQYLMSIS